MIYTPHVIAPSRLTLLSPPTSATPSVNNRSPRTAVASLRGLTRGGRESEFGSFVDRYHVARYVRDSRLRRGSGIVVNGERCGRAPMTTSVRHTPPLRFLYDLGSANRGRRTPLPSAPRAPRPILIRPTFAPAYHQHPPATGAGVAGSKQHMGHVLTRQEEPLWFPDSFR